MNLVQITELAGRPIIDLDSGDVLGQVESWVISPRDQKVLAYVLQRQGWLAPLRVLLTMDVAEYAPRMLVVRDREALIEPREVVGLSELINAKMTMVGFTAEDAQGKKLGCVEQVVFDTVTSLIHRYYIQPAGLRGAIEQNLVLGRHQVVKIENQRVVFDIGASLEQVASKAVQASETA
jgi:uncharacterized protein YrrD